MDFNWQIQIALYCIKINTILPYIIHTVQYIVHGIGKGCDSTDIQGEVTNRYQVSGNSIYHVQVCYSPLQQINEMQNTLRAI